MAIIPTTYSALQDATDYGIALACHPWIREGDGCALFWYANFRQSRLEPRPLFGVELGCAQGRRTRGLIELTGYKWLAVDSDPDWLAIAQADPLLNRPNLNFLQADARRLLLPTPADVIDVGGLIHHIQPEEHVAFLTNLGANLAKDGRIVVSDEFIPDTANEEERLLAVTILYCVVIANGQELGCQELTEGEVWNLLEDRQQSYTRLGRPVQPKSEAAFACVSEWAKQIAQPALLGDMVRARQEARQLDLTLSDLASGHTGPAEENAFENKGDYKFGDAYMRQITAAAGLAVEKRYTFGPIETIGGMAVYVLKSAS